MRLFLKKVFILIICLVFLPSGTFAQESISGCILIERYKLDYKQNYTKYQMHLRLKGGFTVMANLDNSGRFKFETSERLENFDIIFRNYNQKKGYYWPAGQLIGQKIPPFFDRRNCRPQARLNKE